MDEENAIAEALNNGVFSGLPVAGDIALATLGSTVFNPSWK